MESKDLVDIYTYEVLSQQLDQYGYLKPEDIWNYLKEKKWKSSHDLMLSDMVSDILNCDNVLVDDYFKEKINEKNRKVYLDI